MARFTHFSRFTAVSVVLINVSLVCGPLAIRAGEDNQQSTPPLQKQLQSLRAEVKSLREDIRQLNETVKSLKDQQTPSEFSQVTIHLETPDGRPLKGFQVKMRSKGKSVRLVSASGESDRSGLALSRKLPYGEYSIVIEEPSGWRTVLTGTVEVGKPFKRTIVAPDPSERARLKISARLKPEAFGELRFGILKERNARRYSVSPEPDADYEKSYWARQFATFPHMGEGITEPGMVISLGIVREIPQSDGSSVTWRWKAQKLPDLLVTTERVAELEQTTERTSRPSPGSSFFIMPENQEFQDDKTVRYMLLETARAQGAELTHDVAAGNVEVSVQQIVGRPNGQVISALDLNERSDIWLEANLGLKSEWISQILDLENWKQRSGISTYASARKKAVAGEVVEIEVRSPESNGVSKKTAP